MFVKRRMKLFLKSGGRLRARFPCTVKARSVFETVPNTRPVNLPLKQPALEHPFVMARGSVRHIFYFLENHIKPILLYESQYQLALLRSSPPITSKHGFHASYEWTNAGIVLFVLLVLELQCCFFFGRHNWRKAQITILMHS